MQKKIKRGLILVLLCLVLTVSISCSPLGQTQQRVQQLVKVARGDLTLTVSGSGNIEVPGDYDSQLTFGTAGRIDRIYVKEGDNVTKGEVLARLDTSALELAVAQAQVEKIRAQLAIAQAQVSVNQSQLAIPQAQLSLQSAQYELDKATNVYKWSDLQVAESNVEQAKSSLKYAQDRLAAAPPSEQSQWAQLVASAEANLIAVSNKLTAMLSGREPEEVEMKKQQVAIAQQSVDLAEQSLQLAQQSLAVAQQSLDLADKSLKQARKQLDDAVIIAPFDGVAARVNVNEKDTVSPAISVVHLIDPNRLQLTAQMDEIDIPAVKVGQRATVSLDALPGLNLGGKVSAISHLPTEVAGVTVYDVKIEFNVPESAGIRSGMSATADIVVAERKNVLLVPSRAVSRDSQGNTVVKVTVNGKVEERRVVTGISDGTQTEIVDGLSEGEVVVED